MNSRLNNMTDTSQRKSFDFEAFLRKTHGSRSSRRAFTTVELIVATSIVTIVIALVLPAVLHVRESSRKLQCSSNLRELACAVLNYEAVFGQFPPGASNDATWLAVILPQLQEQNRIHEFGLNGRFPLVNPPPPAIYRCPTDPLAVEKTTSYAGNLGAVIQRDGANGVFRHASSLHWPLELAGDIRQRDITDGSSNTAMIAEVLTAPGSYAESLAAHKSHRLEWSTPIRLSAPEEADMFLMLCRQMPSGAVGYGRDAGNGWHINGMMSTFYTHHLPPNSPRCLNGGDLQSGSYSPSSLHGQGAQLAFADGHVRHISSDIDQFIWQGLGSRGGGDSTSF